MSSVRHVQVGGRWEPPPAASGLDPTTVASPADWRALLCQLEAAAPADRRPTLQQAAVRGFLGVSPQLARELAAAAGVPPDAAPSQLSDAQWQRLHERWADWLGRLGSGAWQASWCPQSGAYSLLGGQPQAAGAVLPFLHTYYSVEQRAEQFAGTKQGLVRAVAAAIARLQVRRACGRVRARQASSPPARSVCGARRPGCEPSCTHALHPC